MMKKLSKIAEYILIALFTVTIFLIGIAIVNDANRAEEDRLFLTVGQFEPHFMLFSHERMLGMCENHNLTYDYDGAICIKGK